MSSAKRQLAILKLFTADQPAWTVENIAQEIGVSVSNCYRYVNNLSQDGWLDPVAGKSYMLGPAFIEYDRLIRETDPLLQVAQPIMRDLRSKFETDCAVLLSRVYQDNVMCIHQEISPAFSANIKYERGLPMPMYVGSVSKAILSNLPTRIIKRVFDKYQSNENNVDLGTWTEFRNEMRQLKKVGYCMSRGMLIDGAIGVAAPIFNETKNVLGALSIIVDESDVDTNNLERLAEMIKYHAKEIEFSLNEYSSTFQSTTRIAGTS